MQIYVFPIITKITVWALGKEDITPNIFLRLVEEQGLKICHSCLQTQLPPYLYLYHATPTDPIIQAHAGFYDAMHCLSVTVPHLHIFQQLQLQYQVQNPG